MINLFKKLNKKINSLIFSLISTGIILLFLSILIIWTDFILRFVIGLLVLTLSYAFLYGGYKVWAVKKEIKKHFKF